MEEEKRRGGQVRTRWRKFHGVKVWWRRAPLSHHLQQAAHLLEPNRTLYPTARLATIWWQIRREFTLHCTVVLIFNANHCNLFLLQPCARLLGVALAVCRRLTPGNGPASLWGGLVLHRLSDDGHQNSWRTCRRMIDFVFSSVSKDLLHARFLFGAEK